MDLELPRRVSPADFSRMADQTIAEAKQAEIAGNSDGSIVLYRRAAGWEFEAFALARGDWDARNMSAVKLIGIYFQIGDFKTVIERGVLVLEALRQHSYPETGSKIQEMINKAELQLNSPHASKRR